MRRSSIDLNADLGEGEAHDEFLLGLVSSCNIACGGHTGDQASMTATVRLAVENGVAVGAHPSYPDRDGFGRRSGYLAGAELTDSLARQIDALAAVCLRHKVELKTIKPHGALYNDARTDADLAETLADIAGRYRLTLIGQPGSMVENAASHRGLRFLREGFVDRRYLPNGALCPRQRSGAVIDDGSAAAEQALRLALGRPVATVDNDTLQLAVDTLCLHGDTPHAADIATAVHARLVDDGLTILSPQHD